jgi:hypothetical protein
MFHPLRNGGVAACCVNFLSHAALWHRIARREPVAAETAPKSRGAKKMRNIFTGGIRSSAAVLAALLTVAPTLKAHNKPVHQDITDLSYLVMLAVQKGAVNPLPPPGIPAGEWERF